MPNITETTDAAANTGTAYNLGVGQTAQGTLYANGDHDWYRVDLVAGQTYTFAMTGTGTNNVLDPYLRLYNSSGATLLAQNDDSLQGGNSIFTYTATTTGAYYVDAAAYNNFGTGQYGISVTAGSRASFDTQMGAGVIDTDYSWSAPGAGATVTYAFRLTDSGDETNFSQLTLAQRAAVQSVLAMYSEVCGLAFSAVNPAGYSDNATMLFSNYAADDGAGAYAYYPGSTAATSRSGDVYLNTNSVSTTSLPAGAYSYFALAHEIGHAVGLSHPGVYNAAPGVSITYAGNAQFTQDTHQYSVMSYFDESYTTASYGSYPDTLMLFDVYALQQIYGANYATRAGNTVYGFNSNAGGVYDFTLNTNPALCIWDGAGADTLDVSGFSQNQVISLVDGAFSNIGGRTGNVSIALGAIIENAVGGAGSDTIYLSSQNIANLVNGNGNVDTVYVTYTFGAGYSIQTGSTATNLVMLGSAGTDTFLNVEYVHFSDGFTVTMAELVPIAVSSEVPGDFNGDGNSDLIWRHTSGMNVLWMMDGAQIVGSGALGGDANWSIIDSGDFNGDGNSDLIWHHTNGTNALWLMDGAQIVGSGALGGDANWSIIDSGDFNGDGNSDLIWRHTNGTNAMWLMDGAQVTGSGALGGDTNWSIIDTGDFNGDGNSDLIWRHTSGTNAMWLMDGAQVIGSGALGGDTNWSIIDTGDFNGDGRSDLIWHNTNGTNAMWLMNGAQIVGSAVLGADVNWSIIDTGDFNGDGRSDLIWRHTDGANVLWLMNGTQVVDSGALGGDADWMLVT